MTTVDTTSVWLTPEIVYFVVSKYFLCTCAPPHSAALCCTLLLPCALSHSAALCRTLLCSAALSHALPCSLVLCHTPSHSAVLPCALLCSLALCHALLRSAACLWATFLHFTWCPPGLPYIPHTTFLLSYHLYPCSWTLRTLSI
jgi:hypothetical protein